MFKKIFILSVISVAMGARLWCFSSEEAGAYICASAKEFRGAASQSSPQPISVWVENTARTLRLRGQLDVAESVEAFTAAPKSQQHELLVELIRHYLEAPTWACEDLRALLEEPPPQSKSVTPVTKPKYLDSSNDLGEHFNNVIPPFSPRFQQPGPGFPDNNQQLSHTTQALHLRNTPPC